MSYAFETPKDKNLNLAEPSNAQLGNGLLTSRPSATLVQPLTVQPGNRYSISYLPGLSEKPIQTNLTLDEAKTKIVLLSCEVERLSRSNYDLVKECEFLRLDTDRPSKERQLTNKIAIVLAENEKLNGIIDDIYKAYLGVYQPTSDDLTNYKGRIAEIMTNITKLQQGGATSEPGKVEALEQRIALLLEENEKLNQALMNEAGNKSAGPASNARDGDKRYVELLLEENSKLNDTLNTKVIENENLKREVDNLKQKNMVNQTTYQYQTNLYQKEIEGLKSERDSLNNQIKVIQEENIHLGVEIETLKTVIKEIKLKPIRMDVLSNDLLETVSALSAGFPSLDNVESKFTDFKAFIDSLVEQRLQEIEVLKAKAADLDSGKVDVADVRSRLTQANIEGEKLRETKVELEKKYLEEVDADESERKAIRKDLEERTVRLDRLEREAASLRQTVPTDDLLNQVKVVQEENERLRTSINEVLSKSTEPGSAEEFQTLKLQSQSLAANVEKVSQDLTYYKQRYEKIRSSPPDVVVELLKEAELEAQRRAAEEAERAAAEEANRKAALEAEKARKAAELPSVHVEAPHDDDLKQSNVIESVTRQDAAEEKPIKKVTSAKKDATAAKKDPAQTPRKEDDEFAKAEKEAKAADGKDATKKATKKVSKKPDTLEVEPSDAKPSSRRSSVQGEHLPTESDAPAKKATTTKKTTKAGEEPPKTPSKEAPKIADELKKSDVKKTPTAKDAAGKELLKEEKKEEKKTADKKAAPKDEKAATKDAKADTKTSSKVDKSDTKSEVKSEAKTETKAEAKPAADKKTATGTTAKATKK